MLGSMIDYMAWLGQAYQRLLFGFAPPTSAEAMHVISWSLLALILFAVLFRR